MSSVYGLVIPPASNYAILFIHSPLHSPLSIYTFHASNVAILSSMRADSYRLGLEIFNSFPSQGSHKHIRLTVSNWFELYVQSARAHTHTILEIC